MRLAYAIVILAACGGGGDTNTNAPDAAPIGSDAAPGVDGSAAADAAADAPSVAPAMPCPTSGAGAVVPSGGATCVTMTAAQTGADASGVNATKAEYALVPAAPTGHLVLFLNPSLGDPEHSIADPATNIYTAGAAAGDHVLAIAYRSNQVIGVSCANDDACYLPTRMAVVTGEPQTGAAPVVAQNLLPSEGIYARTALALAYLAAAQPAGGWSQYLTGADPATDPEHAIDWSKVYVMGHSQGGGHAALIAKLHAVARLVTLSSPCDATDAGPATWEHADATWASDPAAIGWGFATATTFGATGQPTGGDTTCPAHAAIWDAMGVPAAHRFEDAAPCSGASAHTATTQCTANMPRVQQLLSP